MIGCVDLDYMITKLGIDEDKVPVMCAQLYKEYGTTMAGLRVCFLVSYGLKALEKTS